MITAEYIKPQAPDLMVVNSARVSFNKQTDAITDKDVRLINYLARENHFTPFTHSRFSLLVGTNELQRLLLTASPEMLTGMVYAPAVYGQYVVRHSLWGWASIAKSRACSPSTCSFIAGRMFREAPKSLLVLMPEVQDIRQQAPFVLSEVLENPNDVHKFTDVTLRETVPIFVARQRFKHVVGFTYNEVSRRYVDDEPEFYTPDVWRKRADNVKQGSSDEAINRGGRARQLLSDLHATSILRYNELLNLGASPEQARMLLPQSMLTSYYVTGSLAAFARAYSLRTHDTAQREIHDLAAQWDAIIRPLFPVSWDVLTEDKK